MHPPPLTSTQQLSRVGLLIANLNRTCEEMRSHILAAKTESAPVLEEASTLLERKRESEEKQQLLDAFCKHFMISDVDLDTLTNSTTPLDDSFFTVLNRVKSIHKDCELLLGHENQRLGLEFMEQTRRSFDAGFKKLYNWIQREFKGLDLEDPHISGSIRRALRVLSERPTLFQNCLDFFAQARESTLSDAFQSALTGTGTTGQAIEFSTHDPLRYIGDMLAWTHSATVSEKEALEGLFISDADEISRGLATGRSSEPWARVRRSSSAVGQDANEDDTETAFDGRKALSDLIGRNMSGVCQTLQQRIELAVKNNDDPVLVYKVYNLLTFYQNIFAKLICPDTAVCKTITQLETFTLTQFEVQMDEETTAATANVAPMPDLAPPIYLQTALRQFSDIARARGPQMEAHELERLFSTVLAGALDACAEGVMQLADHQEGNIYKLNYLTALHRTLGELTAQIHTTQIPLDKANAEIGSLRERAIESLTTSLLDDAGVGAVLQETDARREAGARRQWLQDNLEDAAQKLDDFLSSGLMDAQDRQSRLTDTSLAKEIVAEAVDRFCSEFDELEDMLEGAEDDALQVNHQGEGEELPPLLKELYPRTGVEVRALLS